MCLRLHPFTTPAPTSGSLGAEAALGGQVDGRRVRSLGSEAHPRRFGEDPKRSPVFYQGGTHGVLRRRQTTRQVAPPGRKLGGRGLVSPGQPQGERTPGSLVAGAVGVARAPLSLQRPRRLQLAGSAPREGGSEPGLPAPPSPTPPRRRGSGRGEGGAPGRRGGRGGSGEARRAAGRASRRPRGPRPEWRGPACPRQPWRAGRSRPCAQGRFRRRSALEGSDSEGCACSALSPRPPGRRLQQASDARSWRRWMPRGKAHLLAGCWPAGR